MFPQNFLSRDETHKKSLVVPYYGTMAEKERQEDHPTVYLLNTQI